MASLFDVVDRKDGSPAKHSERTYDFLNRVDGPVWERIRGLIENWWSDHPESARASVGGRIQRGDDHAFRAAFFELYGHQILKRVRDEVVEHPATLTRKQPDFLATSSGMDPLVLELTSTSAADSGKGRAARLANIYDHLNSLVLPNFFLRLEVRTEGAQNPPLGGLKRGLVTWIDGLDVDEVAAKVASSSGYLSDPSAPSYLWEQGGWSIEFGVIPRKRGTREPANNSIGVYGMGDATWVNDVAPIRERLRDKARRYGTFGGPFVVAILLSHWGDDDVAVSGALYGDLAYTFLFDDADSAGKMVRQPNGSWFTPDGWRYANVSAVMAVPDLMPWTVTRTVPTLWHHPFADFAVDAIAPIVRRAIPNLETSEVEFVAPSLDPATFFDLPTDWPGPEPPFAGWDDTN